VLLDGVTPATGRLAGGVVSYFAVPVPAGAAAAGAGLEITVEAITGSFLTLLVTNEVDSTTRTTRLPALTCGSGGCDPAAATGARWSAAGAQFRTRLVISPGDAFWAAGTSYVLALVSAAAADFVLTASLGGSAALLATDLPVKDALTLPGTALFYRVLLLDGVSSVTCKPRRWRATWCCPPPLTASTWRPRRSPPPTPPASWARTARSLVRALWRRARATPPLAPAPCTLA